MATGLTQDQLRKLPDDTWRPPAEMTEPQKRAQQDEAAGGRGKRAVRLANGKVATASIQLKRFKKGLKVWAYLRYQDGPKTVTKYVGDATAPTRGEALRVAWTLARKKKLAG